MGVINCFMGKIPRALKTIHRIISNERYSFKGIVTYTLM